MKKPEEPLALIGSNVWLLKPRIVLWLREGTDVYAPIGMMALIVGIDEKDDPLCLFKDIMSTPDQRRGFSMEWSHLSDKEPLCKCCGQSIASTEFFFKPFDHD